jgi:hypothetical protein
MKNLFFRKRTFLDPTSTGNTSHVLTEVESSQSGEYKWGHYMVTLADCRRRIQLEFFLGTKRARRTSLKKINLLIDVLIKFRDALANEVALIEKESQREKTTKGKTNHASK